MTTVNVAAIAGDTSPILLRMVDRGSASADNVAGRSLTRTHHDDLFKAAYDSFNAIGLTKNYLSSTVSTSGDTTLVAAPGTGNRFSIAWFRIANQSATETTVLIKSGASTELFRAVLAPKGTVGQSLEMVFPSYMPLELATNQALVINLSGANTIGYSIAYHVRA